MIRLSPYARNQLDALIDYYVEKERLSALRKLDAALDRVMDEITQSPRAGLPAPRPYPELAVYGFLWVHVGSYWFAYHHGRGQPGSSAKIVGIFYDRSHIPGLVSDSQA